MSRFIVWADLHNEYWKLLPEVPASVGDFDGILISGDINSQGRHLDDLLKIQKIHGVPVVAILGNHDFYGKSMPDIRMRDRVAMEDLHRAGVDVHVLDRGSVEIGGTRILGTTLWTDYDLFPVYRLQAMDRAKRNMRDHRKIYREDGHMVTPNDLFKIHEEEKSWLLNELKKPFEGETIVMTHHLPHPSLLHPDHCKGDVSTQLVNAAFASNIWSEFRQFDIKAWVCGHSHYSMDEVLDNDHEGVRVIMNTRGYPGEFCGFDPACLLDTDLDMRADFHQQDAFLTNLR